MKSTLHIVFAGGGTGGHLFPGLAVAEKLSANRPGVRITFVGTGKPLERGTLRPRGSTTCPCPAGRCRDGRSEAISFVVENVAGYFAAGRLLDEENVAGVVGLGGYASVPTGRAAARRRLPLVLLEQNVVSGKANRWLSRFASLVCTSFAQTEQQVRWRCPVRWTGNPVRSFMAEESSRVGFSPPSFNPEPAATIHSFAAGSGLNEAWAQTALPISPPPGARRQWRGPILERKRAAGLI